MPDLATTWLETEIVDDAQSLAVQPPAPKSELDFVRLLSAKLPPIKTTGPDWFAYQSGLWQPVSSATFLPAALEIFHENDRTIRKAKTLIEHLEATNQIPDGSLIGFTRFDADSVLINAANGIVRITPTTISLEPHNQTHNFSRQCAASYCPEQTAPLFNRVLGETLPDPDDLALFQLCAGNFLYPDARYETALVCYGEAGRGKSTVADPISSALGTSLVSRLSMTQICDPKSYSLPNLRLSAVNLGTELTTADISESGNFKTVVSGEPVDARPIYGAPFVMRTACKLWFLSNSLPRFKHGTDAELRRTRFLRFDFKPVKNDVTLKGKLATETNAVFNFMLRGLQQLLSSPAIPLGGPASQAVHDRFQISNDPVGSFVSAKCHLDPDARVSTDTLRSAFDDFISEHGLPEICGVWFSRALYERFTTIKQVRTRRNNERCYMISGLRLLPEPFDEIE